MNNHKKKDIKLTSRGRYAVMAMVNLARSEHHEPTPLSDIAEKSDISLSYLEQLIAGLRRHHLVKSYRGPGGGYILNKPSTEISISDILVAAEDSLPAKKKKADEKPGNPDDCEHTAHLWSYINGVVEKHIQDITLDDLILKRLPHPSAEQDI